MSDVRHVVFVGFLCFMGGYLVGVEIAIVLRWLDCCRRVS